MATGGVDPDLDPRKTCSICMESFRGRHPKLLPCFHTFCLPCLRQLTCEGTQQLSQEGQENGGVKIEIENGTRCTLLCPTCRAVTHVPSGGVTKMQNNFYIKEDSLPAPACDLCDGEQTAKYSCTKCPNKVCSQCRRCHDKFCQATGLIEINQTQTRDSSSVKREEQIQLVEKVLKTLSSQKDRLAQERERIEHKIHGDHAALLGLADEARDASLKNVKTCTEQTVDKLRKEADDVNGKLRKLRRKRSLQSACSEDAEMNLLTLSEPDVRSYQDLLKQADEETLLEYKLEDANMAPLMNSLCDFVSTVTQRSRGPGLILAPESPEAERSHLSGNQQTPVEASEQSSTAGQALVGTLDIAFSVDQLSKDFAECKKIVALLQTDNAALHKDYFSLHKDNAALLKDSASLLKDNADLHKEMAAIVAKNTSLCATIATLEKDTLVLKEASTTISALEKEMKTLRETSTRTQEDLPQLKTNMATLQKDVGSLSQDVASGKTDLGQLQKDKMSQNRYISSLQTGLSELKSTVASNQTTVSSLDTKLAKSTCSVAFHAILSDSVTTREKTIIICDHTVTSVGGGYDNKTGVFTAPVTGTYCFMVTTSPNKLDRTVRGRLDVIHNSNIIGYVLSVGNSWSTGHTCAKVNAGEQVYLQTYDELEYSFAGLWWTTFSGMLLQAEL